MNGWSLSFSFSYLHIESSLHSFFFPLSHSFVCLFTDGVMYSFHPSIHLCFHLMYSNLLLFFPFPFPALPFLDRIRMSSQNGIVGRQSVGNSRTKPGRRGQVFHRSRPGARNQSCLGGSVAPPKKIPRMEGRTGRQEDRNPPLGDDAVARALLPLLHHPGEGNRRRLPPGRLDGSIVGDHRKPPDLRGDGSERSKTLPSRAGMLRNHQLRLRISNSSWMNFSHPLLRLLLL